jgi:hypothetical protein
MLYRKLAILLACVVGLISVTGFFFFGSNCFTPAADPIVVIKNYIEATYARNFPQAYRLISIKDQRIRNEQDYVREQGAYDGFTLRLAKSLAEKMDFAVLEDKRNGQRARITVRFKLPSPEDLSPLAQNWDSEKLNSISPVQQRQILESIEKLRRDKKLLMVESQQTFELIKEGKDWRLFFDWAGGTKVRFGFLAPPGSGIEVEFQEKEIIANPRDPFIVHFQIKYRGNREVSAKIVHRIEPPAVRENLQMIQCGLLSPINLSPGSEQEMASVYLFDGNLSEVKKVFLAYEFKIEPAAPRVAHTPRAVSTTKRM